jgi:capsular exopolysaccharide synthesis family protein
LAIALAQRGEPTLLIDADLRHPGIAEPLHLVNGKGLASFLTGAHGIEEALGQFSPVPSLWVLPAGPTPPNPAQLLSSSAMESMLEELRKRFKFLVIDSPPVLSVTDAMVLSTFVDGVVFIVASGTTVRGAVMRPARLCKMLGQGFLASSSTRWMCAMRDITATTTIDNFAIMRMLKGNRASQKRSFHAAAHVTYC